MMSSATSAQWRHIARAIDRTPLWSSSSRPCVQSAPRRPHWCAAKTVWSSSAMTASS
ncbi:unnamed protein product [Symbiodinium pilosum]|uniref:Uncharacterized protein n=1 Tax=Symbiodinium pilosum TaxID=2952 RepID=A0A812S8T4_SYMPI|nr:unnamed protein product [Symbiodinium pilosum]